MAIGNGYKPSEARPASLFPILHGTADLDGVSASVHSLRSRDGARHGNNPIPRNDAKTVMAMQGSVRQA